MLMSVGTGVARMDLGRGRQLVSPAIYSPVNSSTHEVLGALARLSEGRMALKKALCVLFLGRIKSKLSQC